jgi:uncharacterized membrane protein YqgA involved in biofilm formation
VTGTIINVIAILVGSGLGLLLGGRLPEKLKQTVVSGIGLFTLALGVSMFLQTKNSLVVLGALLIGAMIGEWMRIEERLTNFGGWLEARFNRPGRSSHPASLKANDTSATSEKQSSQERFIRGFLTASLIYLVGPLAILGSIQDGLKGDYQLLAVKSVLDGFTAVAFASSLGIGVAFSAIPTLFYQGLISLLAAQVEAVTSTAMMTEMTATGGVILLAIAFSSLLEIKKIRAGNFLPALFVAPMIVWVMTALGISLSLP